MRPVFVILSLLVTTTVFSQVRNSGYARYAVVLSEPAVALKHQGRTAMATSAAQSTRQKLASSQRTLSAQLTRLGGKVMGSEQDLVNAIFVMATPDAAAAMRNLPGVDHVEKLRPVKPLANKALNLINTSAGWARITGGEGQAGAGVKIGVIDTGIDQTHPSFQDSALTMPAGFPHCSDGVDCGQWTNSKVIVARSYVSLSNFQYGTNPSNTRPDDVTPRDRDGHGTMQAMLAAGIRTTNSGVSLTGVAPKAYLGNYKIFGSPGVNEVGYTNAVIAALNDARADGMDIAILSLGSPAGYSALDRICGDASNQICDVMADAVQAAVLAGLTVVTAGGNDGALPAKYPALGSIYSPGTAPAAITVGASTNAHIWYQTLTVNGLSASPINMRLGTGPQLAASLTAPLRSVTTLDTSGEACSALPGGSLAGTIAVVRRGNCDIAVKVNNAAAAGAVAVVLEQTDGVNDIFSFGGLSNTAIPLAMIGSNSGKALRDYLAANADRPGTLNPAFREVDATSDYVSRGSSQGPSIGDAGANKVGDFLIKPELVAPGTDLLMATQKYDPNSVNYSPSGFQVSDGTSFAASLVAGAAALVKQRYPSFTPAGIKSAVVNSADSVLKDLTNEDAQIPARVTGAGAGKLNVGNALNVTVTAEPATLSFGVVIGNPTLTRPLVLRNATNGPLTLAIEIQPNEATTMSVTALLNGAPINGQQVVSPAGSLTLSMRLSGTQPVPGSYSGFVKITQQNSTSTPLRIPYLFLVGDGVPYNMLPLGGDGFLRPPGTTNLTCDPKGTTTTHCVDLLFKVVDRFGVPVRNFATTRSITSGNAAFTFAAENTDAYGIAVSTIAVKGTGPIVVTITAGNSSYEFNGTGRARMVLNSDGVTNAASGQGAGSGGFAAGSYISLFGSALSDNLKVFSTPYLPISLAGVSVSFDSEANHISVPGHIHFVSPSQVNVQIPWEVQGLTSVSMKVSFGDYFQTSVIEVPIAAASPAYFEYTEASGEKSVAALDGSFRVVGGGNPVRRGEAVQLYVNGLGDVDNRPGSGEVALSQPLSNTRVVPTVTIGGRPAQVIFSGLAPGNVGLYQVNAIVPADSPTGRQPVTCTVNGVAAPSTFIAVQ